MDYKPEFLVIPTILFDDKSITPVDCRVYGAIYWLSQLNKGKCFASDATIAEIAKVSSKSVKNSLARLENGSFIERTHKDKERKKRTDILPTVRMTQTKDGVSQRHHWRQPTPSLASTGDQNKNKEREENTVAEFSEKSGSSSDFKDLMDFFSSKVYDKLGFKPQIDGGDGARLKVVVRTHAPADIKDMILFYLSSRKAKEMGVTLKAVLSTHSINLWKQDRIKSRFL